jgi:iron complex outermembrane receptor protein
MRIGTSAACTLLVSCSLGLGDIACAQSAQNTNEDSDSYKLQEVIVEARRIDENLQTVPVAVTVLTGAELQERSITEFQDLQFAEPSLSFSQTLQRDDNRITLRGQSTAYASDYPGVDTLFADVPIAAGGSTPFFDMQSVQVLKGPQGVAFGRNTTGGAVLMYPARPDENLEGYVDARYGNFDHREAEAMLNIPLSGDTLMLRIAAHFDQQDGFTKNLITGTDLDDDHSSAWRVSLLYKPFDGFENSTVVSGENNRTHGAANHIIYFSPTGLVAELYPSYVAYATAALALGRNQIESDYDGYDQTQQLFLANTTTANLGSSLTLKNVLGIQRDGGAQGTDMDGIPLPVLEIGQDGLPGQINQTISDELQLQGKALGDRLRWLTGLFYSYARPVSEGEPFQSVSLGGLFPNPTVTTSDQFVSSIAPFGQITLPLNFIGNRWSTTLGARYTTDRRESLQSNVIDGKCGFTTGACDVDLHGKWTGWNWAATLNYQVTDATLLYAASRHGFKGGAFNPTAVDPALLLVKPETVTDAEVGIKSDWSIGTVQVRTNAAAYYQWYDDIVRSAFVFVDGVAFALNRNVAQASIKGVEFETTIVPLRHLELTAFYSYTDALYGAATDPTYIFMGSKHFPDVPKNKAGLTAQYSLPLPESLGDLVGSGSANYESSRAVDQNAISPFAYQGGYTLLNFKLDWRHTAGSGFDVGGYVKNAADKKYLLAGGDFSNSLGFIQALYGEPRTYGVDVRYSFGK